MNRTLNRLTLWGVGAALAVALCHAPVFAADPHALEIRVSITASKSLSVNTTFYNFGALPISSAVVSLSSITVTNNSGALIETYTIQGANADSTESGTNWTLITSSTSLGTNDEYALAAVFSASSPGADEPAWVGDYLDPASPIVCTSTTLGNGTPLESGAAVSPVAAGQANKRGLWFRIHTPTTVSDPTQRLATITLAVQ